MTKRITISAVHTIGLDIAKTRFSVHGFDAEGRTVLTKGLKRYQVLPFFAERATSNARLDARAPAHQRNSILAQSDAVHHDTVIPPDFAKQ